MIVCHDEPIDLNAVRADESLINALSRGDPDLIRTLLDSDDELAALLIAWIAAARPATAEVHLMPAHARAAAGAVVTECCHRRLDDLPDGDGVTDERAHTTCPEMQP